VHERCISSTMTQDSELSNSIEPSASHAQESHHSNIRRAPSSVSTKAKPSNATVSCKMVLNLNTSVSARTDSALTTYHKLRGSTISHPSVSGGSAFDTEAIARHKSKRERATKRATRDRHQCVSPTDSLSIAATESTHPAWARVATGQSIPSSIASSLFTIFTNCLLGLLIIFEMCVIAPARAVFAGCFSSHPPWAASSPTASSFHTPQHCGDSKQPQAEDTRRPSTEYMWAFEALSFDYEF